MGTASGGGRNSGTRVKAPPPTWTRILWWWSQAMAAGFCPRIVTWRTNGAVLPCKSCQYSTRKFHGGKSLMKDVMIQQFIPRCCMLSGPVIPTVSNWSKIKTVRFIWSLFESIQLVCVKSDMKFYVVFIHLRCLFVNLEFLYSFFVINESL